MMMTTAMLSTGSLKQRRTKNAMCWRRRPQMAGCRSRDGISTSEVWTKNMRMPE